MERRLQKDFQIGPIEGIVNQVIQNEKGPKDVFSQIAKAIGRRSSGGSKKKDWNAMVRQNTIPGDPIGSSNEAVDKQHRRSLRRRLQQQGESALESLDPARLLEYNPNLQDLTDTTKVAYAKFMLRRPAPKNVEGEGAGDDKPKPEGEAPRQRVAITEPPKADKPSGGAPARLASQLSKKSLSKSGSQDGKPASKATLDARPSQDGRTPSPIPEEPEQPKAAAPKAPLKSSMKRQTSSAPKPKEDKPKEDKPAAPAPAPASKAQPPPKDTTDHPTTQQRGRSKATGQIVGGWI